MENDQPDTAADPEASHWQRDDRRWGRVATPRRDWVILFTMILIYLVWTGIIFAFEPGIR